MLPLSTFALQCILALFISRTTAVAISSDQNLVDLGYAKHVPTWVNVTSTGTELLNYNNIRYAEAPLGWKRFRKPVTPPSYQSGIQDGNQTSFETDCISSAPAGVPFPEIRGKSWGSEDCLFLNVIVPKGAKEGDKLPVLHAFVGSAFAFGGKDLTGLYLSLHGIYNRPLNITDQFIFVAHNYRLGITGWLPRLEDDLNGNVGVWDSLAATEWTKKYIHNFGGDPDNITVMGQSSGAAIITWLLLAEEGQMTLPFTRAMISSPALPPRKTLERSRPIFNEILNATGCANVECMRQLPESTIKDANKYILDIPSAGGGGALGPGIGLSALVDGELLAELPAAAMAKGKINQQIESLIVGSNADEGRTTGSDRDMPARFANITRANIPKISDENIAKLQSMYEYPPELPEKLAWDYTKDIVFGCPAANIAAAYKEKAHRYLFSIDPADHGAEILYFFFGSNITTPVSSIETAYEAQSYLLQLIFGKDFPINPAAPYAGSLSGWPTFFRSNQTIANITVHGFVFGPPDKKVAERCQFINMLLEDPANGV